MTTRILHVTIAASIAAFAAVATVALAQDVIANSGDLAPRSALEARRALMRSVDAVMQQIEPAVPADLDDQAIADLQQRYVAVSGMLLAFPHLFPAGSDIAEPSVADGGNASISTPAVWTDFPTLVMRAQEASEIAQTASMTPREGLADQAVALRNACSSCHETFMEYRSPF